MLWLYSLGFSLLWLCFLNVWCQYVTSKTLLILIPFFFTGYWLVSIFSYLSNTNVYGRYTTAVRRFWRRAFSLFWVLELVLFFVYFCLLLNSPIETEWFLDQLQLYRTKDLAPVELLWDTFLVLLTLYVTFYVLKNYNSQNTLVQSSTLVISCILFIILVGEFFQLYYFNSLYTFNKVFYETEVNEWCFIVEKGHLRTFWSYLILIVFLKFWHTVFIVFTFFYTNFFSLGTEKTSYFKLNYQNLLFLYIFSLFSTYGFSKYLLDFYTGFYYNNFFITTKGSCLSAYSFLQWPLYLL